MIWLLPFFMVFLMMLKVDLTSIVFCIIIGIREEHQRLREHRVSTQSKEENRDTERIIA